MKEPVFPAHLRVSPLDVGTLPYRDTLGMGVRIYLSLNWSKWSPSTKRLYLRSMGVLSLAGLWTEHLPSSNFFSLSEAVRRTVKSKGIMAQTMTFLRAVTAHSYKMGHIHRDPLANHQFIMGNGKGWEEWTVEELARVPAEASCRIGQAIHFAAISGQRLTDILNLERRNFSQDGKTVTMKQSKTGAFVVLPVTEDMRRLSYVDMAVRCMGQRTPLDASQRVFKYASERQFKHQYYTITKRLGIKKPFHGLRKLCAIRMAEAGCSMPEIMAVTGHTSTTTAMKYIKGADKYILAKRAMDRVKQMEDDYAVE